ncbi:putative lipid II flippase FtsW [Parahalioglobus pacificus]|uniref:Probable peptidoglycan glycosyltransferase FtsW n=1 Tax=Parahalioglobus pacificus TaxID=930806 RepID=A0A918XDJ2_9GAMM|nr:putative lipid II flippase FtsW [Halioglobus pacificus]GHD25969.1 putative lipid II flippase FtsW [Halioglobus pacificus]
MPRSVAQHRSLLAIDPLLGLLGLALILVGLIAISSASIEYGDWHYGNPWHHTQRHLVYILAATVAGVITYRIPVGFWEQTGWAWLLVALALLVLVLVPGIGKEVKGSQRWIQLGAFTLQPSELAKVALVIYLAGYMVRQEEEVRGNWRGFLKPMAVVGAVALLLMVEPDFGATVICAGTAMGMLFLGGVRLGHFLLMLLVGLLGLVALVFSAPYRVARLTAYTDPWADPFGAGFQLIQSLIAFGRGEWLGVGLGNSVQKLFYLPEAHNDFVFSIWAEETGFIGAMLVMGLFAALIGRILWVARQALSQGQKFGAYVCYGTALIFSGQAFVNMGVSSGLLPTKGLTLPFVSYGGTSLIMSCCLLALVLRVERSLDTQGGRTRG